jgi:hypothetical protein
MDTPEEIKPEPVKKVPTKAPKLKMDDMPIKPQVEGINAPRLVKTAPVVAMQPPLTENTTRLTDQEKRLVIEDLQPEPEKSPIAVKLMPESVIRRESQKQGHAKEIIISIIIILALVFGGYQAYLWNQKRHNTLTPVAQLTTTTSPSDLITSPITDTTASNPTATSTAPTTTTTPTTSAKKLKIEITPTGYLNVRSTPSSTGKLVTQVHPGEIYSYIEKQTGWYKITLTDGSSGWVSAQYISVQ